MLPLTLLRKHSKRSFVFDKRRKCLLRNPQWMLRLYWSTLWHLNIKISRFKSCTAFAVFASMFTRELSSIFGQRRYFICYINWCSSSSNSRSQKIGPQNDLSLLESFSTRHPEGALYKTQVILFRHRNPDIRQKKRLFSLVKYLRISLLLPSGVAWRHSRLPLIKRSSTRLTTTTFHVSLAWIDIKHDKKGNGSTRGCSGRIDYKPLMSLQSGRGTRVNFLHSRYGLSHPSLFVHHF